MARLRMDGSTFSAVVLALSCAACVTSDPPEIAAQMAELIDLPAQGGVSAPDLMITDPTILSDLERSGWAFHNVIGATSPALSAAIAAPMYRAIIATLDRDLEGLALARRAVPMEYRNGVAPVPGGKGWVGSGQIGGDGTYSGGISFNTRWFRASSARFELVAVANRMDLARRDANHCGETRFIYRMAYTGPRESSRLPALFSVIWDNPKQQGSCQTLAHAWAQRTSTDTASAYISGPLAVFASRRSPDRIETNLQSFRNATATYPTTGGRFEYLLRAFATDVNGATPLKLPNTPRENLSPAEVTRLRAYLIAHSREVDDGTVEIPAEYLADRVLSAAPYGLSLRTNRAFGRYFSETGTDFPAATLLATTRVRTQTAFVRRLDQLSCNGCHATRSIAGFHAVGREADGSTVSVPMEIGLSAHLLESLPHRRAILAMLESSATAPTAPEPFPEHAQAGPGPYGAHCGLRSSGLEDWTCATGLSCVRVSEDRVGRCLPLDVRFGAACFSGRAQPAVNRPTQYTPSPRAIIPADWDHYPSTGSRLNIAPSIEQSPSGIKFCNRNGWPDGSRQISSTQTDRIGSGDQFGIAIPTLRAGIDLCFLQGQKSFTECLRADPSTPTPPNSEPPVAVLGRCDVNQLCGDNYACGRMTSSARGNGVCLPPYFIPSLQLLGHDVR